MEQLIGRDRPRAILDAEIGRTLDSHGGLVFVTGEPGIGKTALVTEAVDAAHARGAAVLRGTCWSGADAPGYWPWQQVMRQLKRDATADEWACAVDVAGEGMGFLLGELYRPPASEPSGQDTFRLADAAATVLVTVSRSRPLVIALDDLHWADVASVRMLDFIVRHSWFERILIVGTYRDVEVEAPGHPLASELRPLASRATTVRLSGLDTDAVHDLLARTAGREPEPSLVSEVHRRSGGNPLFVEQLARLWQSGAPLDATSPEIRDVVDHRLRALPSAVTEVLTAAAVLGPEVHQTVVAAVAARPEAEVNQIVAQAARMRLVETAADGRFTFSHDLLRETLYAAVDDERRKRLHAGAVAAYERLSGRLAPAPDAELAHHAYLAVPVIDADVAVRRLLAVARLASCRRAPEEAERHYRRALELLPDDRPWRRAVASLALGEAQHRSGRIEPARATFEHVVTMARRLGDPVLLGRAALGLHHLGHVDGRAERAEIELMDEASAALGAEHAEGALAARLLAASARARVHEGPDADVGGTLDRAVTLARAADDDAALGFALLARHDAIWRPGTAAERLALADEMRSAAVRSDDHEREFEASSLRMTALLELDDPRYLDELAVMERIAERSGLPRLRFVALSRRGSIATVQGRFDEARVRIDEAFYLGERLGEGDRKRLWRDQRWALGLATGDLDGLARLLDTEASGHDGVQHDAFEHVLRALVAVRSGDVDDAVRRLPQINALAGEAPPWFGALWLAVRAEIAAATADPSACANARAALEPLEGNWAVVFGGGVVLGPVAYYLALLDAAESRWDSAVARFSAATESAETMLAKAWSVEARAGRAGALLARAGTEDVDTGAALLGEVERDARSLGMEHVVRWCVRRADDVSAGRRHDDAGAGGHVVGDRRGDERRGDERRGDVGGEHAVGEFSFDGSVWTLTFGGRTAHLPDAKGLRDLHLLLGRPGTDVAATDMLDPAAGEEARRARGLGGDPVLDETAKAQYRERLTSLDAEIERAVDAFDDEKAAALDQEREALIAELRAAAGLGGRDRRLGDEAERSRKTVTARIKDTMRRLDERHPELAEHLRSSVSTGVTCRYQPAVEVTWRL